MIKDWTGHEKRTLGGTWKEPTSTLHENKPSHDDDVVKKKSTNDQKDSTHPFQVWDGFHNLFQGQ